MIFTRASSRLFKSVFLWAFIAAFSVSFASVAQEAPRSGGAGARDGALEEQSVERPGPLTDVFEIRNVTIDETAETVGKAKATGIATGVQNALISIFQRITLNSDWSRLPVVAEDQIEGFVRDISLSEERFGGGRYLASLTVRFKPEMVRRILRRSAIPYAETVSLPVIALPILDTGREQQLWEPSNLWREGWAKAQLQQSLAPVLPPFGDLSDVSAISAQQALAGALGPASQFAARYQAGGVYVTVARPGVAPGGGFRITVSSFAIGAGLPSETEVDMFTFPASTPLPDAYTVAALGVAEAHHDRWKLANLISQDQESGVLTVAVSLSGLTDWVAIQRKLSSIRDVKTVRLAELSVREAILELEHIGDIDRFRRALAQNRFRLNEDLDTGQWVLTAVP